MKRRLRIAVSVFFAIVAVTALVMWPRSYWRIEGIQRTTVNTISAVLTVPGAIRITWLQIPPSRSMPQLVQGWVVISEEVDPDNAYGPQIDWRKGPYNWHLTLPHWVIALTSSIIAAIAWPRRSYQFSLRTMLIATTLVAVVLGLAVWAGR
jgi:hypothetical protein